MFKYIKGGRERRSWSWTALSGCQCNSRRQEAQAETQEISPKHEEKVPNFFVLTMVKHWKRLPRDVVRFPSLEMRLGTKLNVVGADGGLKDKRIYHLNWLIDLWDHSFN